VNFGEQPERAFVQREPFLRQRDASRERGLGTTGRPLRSYREFAASMAAPWADQPVS
jgi:hypothetical protein